MKSESVFTMNVRPCQPVDPAEKKGVAGGLQDAVGCCRMP